MSFPSPGTNPPPLAGVFPSRETEAAQSLESTRFSKSARAVLLSGFLAISFSSIASSLVTSLSTIGDRKASSFFSPLSELLPHPDVLATITSPADLWKLLPTPAALRSLEESIQKRASLSAVLRPQFQSLLFRLAGAGNEQAVPAPEGWLFFRKDLDYLNGKPFLEKNIQDARAKTTPVAPDSIACIVSFQRQLASRGIDLLVIPVPVKPCLESHRFYRGKSLAEAPLQNASYDDWLKTLEAQGIAVFDPAPLLLERARRDGEAQFLKTDTHWTPPAMEAVAQAVARKIDPETNPSHALPAKIKSAEVTSQGDTVALLGLPQDQSLIPQQTVTIHPVFENQTPWKPDHTSNVLLLGDSFSNIYSLGAMGWGESAGFAEHLSASLGRPIDALIRNSDGAFATRQMLQKELAAGNDRLRGKKTVVWEFAIRELAFGDWKMLPLPDPKAQGRSFLCPPPGGKQRVRGSIAAVAPIPRPGSVPYKEHIVVLHLTNVFPENAPAEGPQQCLVYLWSMREQQPTAAARLRPGETVSLELVPWEDVSESLEKFQRSELDDTALLLEPATWAAELR